MNLKRFPEFAINDTGAGENMAKVEPKAFVLSSQEGAVEIVDVQLYEDIKSDRDGRAHSHFSLSGRVKAALTDFETITVGLKFSFYDQDDRLGDTTAQDLRLGPDDDSVAFGPLNGPVASSDARVSRLEVEIETSVVTKANRTVELERSET